jgi:hypothetical protein
MIFLAMKKDTGAGAWDSSLWSQNSRLSSFRLIGTHLFFIILTLYPLLISLLQTVKMKLIIVATLLSAVAAFTGTPLKTAVSHFTVLFSCSRV